MFITFEGIDGSGKSTHLSRAVAWLRQRGLPVEMTREPGGTELGDAIRDVFLDPRWGRMDSRVEAMLVFASRRQHLIERIEPALDAGTHVLCDRFTDSSLVYQGAVGGLGREWILELDRLATGGRRPDHTLLFVVPAELAHQRGSDRDRAAGPPDRLDVKNLAFYQRVREAYLAMADADPERFLVVDSSASADVTWVAVERHLTTLFSSALSEHAEAP